jgi:CheY-like chemotaxis protein/anti-sigma regulatory factor (Ser/Thr protein kinase)
MDNYTPHILVVDDEPFNRDIIRHYLEDEEYEMSEADDGDKALQLLKEFPDLFDIVLLDRMMPNINGLEVLKEMKKDPELSNIPVILQTARSTKEDIKEGIDQGAYFYLTKPFEEEMLLSMVRSAIEERNNYLQFKQSLDESVSSLSMMENGFFKFRTIDEARILATHLAKACPEPEKRILGLTELFINAIEHGNLKITYEEKGKLVTDNTWLDEIEKRLSLTENKNKYAEVAFKRNEENITIIIKDQGEGFNWKEYLDFSPERVFDNHGRGIASSKMISLDELNYNDIGNEATVIIYLAEKLNALDKCA